MVPTSRRGVTVAGAVLAIAAAGMMTTRTTLLAQNSSPAAGQVTFTRDVAPILQRSCQNCHRAGFCSILLLLLAQIAKLKPQNLRFTSYLRFSGLNRSACIVHKSLS